MLSRRANERLTRVGAGTPMGELLRRYWHPVATVSQLCHDSEPLLPAKALGEELKVFLDSDGCPGVLGLERPYPAQEMGGLVWAYLGPEPAPLLPRYDLFVRDDLEREIGVAVIPCNWLQIMENSLDPVHAEHLHGVHANYMLRRRGKPEMRVRKHVRFDFDVFDYGITKRRLLEGQSEDVDDWRIGHPVLFPNILAVGTDGQAQFQLRVPIDDTRTMHWWYLTRKPEPGQAPVRDIPLDEFVFQHENGRFMVETAMGQDIMAWITAGPIADRTSERLATSDRGIILYRQLLQQQLRKIQRGEDPIAVVRDAAANEPWIEIPREHEFEYQGQGFLPVSNPDFPFAVRRRLI